MSSMVLTVGKRRPEGENYLYFYKTEKKLISI